tara:strand:- start:1521 stop:2510 length:990 start_codon:yes stop_codon:yes gene_type:complete
MKPYLRIKENPGESISFLIGNTFREVLFKPWKVVILPLTLYKRIRLQREKQRTVLKTNIEILYLVDAESLMEKDFSMYKKILSCRGNDLIATIGDFGPNVDYLIPSRKSNVDTKNQWNSDLEKTLESIIASRRPKKFIFIGKYPYAGLLSVIRRLESQKFTAWLPARAQPKAIKERAFRFGSIIEWDSAMEPAIELDLDRIYIDPKFPLEFVNNVSQWAKEHGLSHSNPHDAGLQFYSESGIGRVKSALERGNLVVYIYESQLDAEFSSKKYAPIFFPIYNDNQDETEYSIKQILALYTSNELHPRTLVQNICEKWNDTIQDTFTQKFS